MIAKQETTYYDVVGIGNAIVDVLAKVGEGFLKERNLPKGGMTLVDAVTAGKNRNRHQFFHTASFEVRKVYGKTGKVFISALC